MPALTIEPLHPDFGARVTGVTLSHAQADLARALSAMAVATSAPLSRSTAG